MAARESAVGKDPLPTPEFSRSPEKIRRPRDRRLQREIPVQLIHGSTLTRPFISEFVHCTSQVRARVKFERESSSSPSQVRVTSQVRARVKSESRVKFESGSVSSVFFFIFLCFCLYQSAVIVILAFIMMCQLMHLRRDLT